MAKRKSALDKAIEHIDLKIAALQAARAELVAQQEESTKSNG